MRNKLNYFMAVNSVLSLPQLFLIRPFIPKRDAEVAQIKAASGQKSRKMRVFCARWAA